MRRLEKEGDWDEDAQIYLHISVSISYLPLGLKCEKLKKETEFCEIF